MGAEGGNDDQVGVSGQGVESRDEDLDIFAMSGALGYEDDFLLFRGVGGEDSVSGDGRPPGGVDKSRVEGLQGKPPMKRSLGLRVGMGYSRLGLVARTVTSPRPMIMSLKGPFTGLVAPRDL